MNREQLEHAIRAACDVLGGTELYIFRMGTLKERTTESDAHSQLPSPKEASVSVGYLSAYASRSRQSAVEESLPAVVNTYELTRFDHFDEVKRGDSSII
ncbi:hypothetical protein NC796_00100 [Aliifodinibius sp. S!AR15-10]|nr:hypothetical protein [Aliifodinibius sp. S!AR15-10]